MSSSKNPSLHLSTQALFSSSALGGTGDTAASAGSPPKRSAPWAFSSPGKSSGALPGISTRTRSFWLQYLADWKGKGWKVPKKKHSKKKTIYMIIHGCLTDVTKKWLNWHHASGCWHPTDPKKLDGFFSETDFFGHTAVSHFGASHATNHWNTQNGGTDWPLVPVMESFGRWTWKPEKTSQNAWKLL